MSDRALIRRGCAISAVWLVSVLAACGQDFGWSWQGDEEAKPEVVVPVVDSSADVPVAAPGVESDFGWSWNPDSVDPATDPVMPPAVPVQQEAAQVRSDEAYQNLLKENLELRRKMSEALKDEALARKESQRFATEISEMEKNLAESVKVIRELRESQGAAAAPDQVGGLELRVAEAEKARDAMAAELDRLKRLRDDGGGEQAARRSGVVAGSDLFREQERENVLLKQRLIEIETERRKLEQEAVKARQEAEKARQAAQKAGEERDAFSEKALAAARQGVELKKIAEKLPEIKEQVTTLKSDVMERDTALTLREDQLAAMKVELERREHRLAKAQRMTELLERARAEVQQVDNREKMNMHYNMAVIYAKEGRSQEAEEEYLKALRIDPSDADVHYNLGILYDQDLADPGRAAVHYRRYVSLRPHASDVDQVRGWIMDLQMTKLK